MGYVENNQSKIFNHIKEGRIIHKDKDGTIHSHGGLKGRITDLIYNPDGKFGAEFHVILFDEADGSIHQLQMRFNSGYARAFLRIMKNIDFTTDVVLVPDYKKAEGKEFADTGMIIRQGESALKWYYTKDDPKDLPPMVKVRAKTARGFEDVWDNTEQMEFLLKVVYTEIKPLLKPATENPWDGSNQSAVDDLPF